MVSVVPDAVLEDTKRVRSSLRPVRSEEDGYAGTVGGARRPGLGLRGEGGAVDVEAATSCTGGTTGVGGGGNSSSNCVELRDILVRSDVSS